MKTFYHNASECGRLNLEYYGKEKILSVLGLSVNGKLNNAGYYLFSKDVKLNLKLKTFATDQKLTFLDLKLVSNNIYNLVNIGIEYISNHIN